ncbi:MAG: acyltransferase [Alphaproteobacteria bacterium]|nr:acyltransferase [Alphaproteobacteria bacterium]
MSPPSPPRAPEIVALSGARGLPALFIVAFHFHEAFGYRGLGAFDALLNKGYLYVEFFFILSGFTLTYVYRGGPLSQFSAGAYRDFLAARAARLYPGHYFMLFAILGLEIVRRALIAEETGVALFDVPAVAGRTAETFITNLLLIQAWNIDSGLSWNGPAWFLSVMLFLYLLFPLMLTAMGDRFGMRSLLLAIAGGGVLAAIAYTSGRGLDVTFHNGLFRGLGAFLVGCGIATAISAIPKERVWTWLLSVAQVLCAALLVAAFLYGGKPRSHADLAIAGLLAALIFLLAFDRGLIARAVTHPLIMKLGELSLAIYLTHFFFIQLVRMLRRYAYPAPDMVVFGAPFSALFPAVHWIELAFVMACATFFGWLLHRYLEQPAGTALRRLLSRARPAPAQ